MLQSEAELFACCSLLFARCLFLVTFCSLLLVFCSLLLTFCSLLVYFLLLARYFFLVPHYFFLVIRYFLPVAPYFLLVIFSSKLLWHKVIVNRKKAVWLERNSAADTFRANFWDFGSFFWMEIFKVFSTYKIIFKVENVTNFFEIFTNIAEIDVNLMFLLQYMDMFSSTFMYLKSQK